MRTHRFHFPLVLAAALCISAGARGQEQSDESKLKAQAQAEIDKEMGGLPTLGERELEETIGFVVRDGKLRPFSHVQIADAHFHSVKLKGMAGAAKISIGPQDCIQFDYRDLTVPETIAVYTSVSSGPEFVDVSQFVDLGNDEPSSVQLVQAETSGPQAVNLYIQIPHSASPGSERFSAASLDELCRRHPSEVDTYLRPIFRLLGQEQAVFEVERRTVYQVFSDEWPADPAAVAATDAVVGQLAADSYTEREAALARLRNLGEPAALYLMRRGDGGLSSEQAMRVDLFLAAYRPLPDEQVQRLKSDPDFLLDCLFSSDATVRDLALRQLGRVTGKPIAIDQHLSGTALDDAVTKLRQELVAKPSAP